MIVKGQVPGVNAGKEAGGYKHVPIFMCETLEVHFLLNMIHIAAHACVLVPVYLFLDWLYYT